MKARIAKYLFLGALIFMVGVFVVLNMSGFCYDQRRWLSDEEMCERAMTQHLPTIGQSFGEGNYHSNLTALSAAWKAHRTNLNREPRAGEYGSGCVIARWFNNVDFFGHDDLPRSGRWLGYYRVAVQISHLSVDGQLHRTSFANVNACGKVTNHRCCDQLSP